MLQLMIVDDETLAINAIQTCIEWSDLGIARVFTANSARQAREIFSSSRIDIMLCDIEMPQENGLQLLAWVKSSHPETATIIQSCHSDFIYAKKALQLESVDYILKPVLADDLANALRKAIKKIEVSKKYKSQKEADELGQSLPILPHLLKSADHIDNLFLEKTIENQTDIPDDCQMLPVLAVIKQPDGRANLRESGAAGLLVADLECICSSKNIKMIELDYNVYLILLLNWKAGADTSELDHIFESAFQNVLDSCGFDLMGCIGVKVDQDGLIPVIKHLLRTCRNNLSDTSHRISQLNDELNNRNQYAIPDISYWAMLLEASSDKKLIEEVSSFFSGIPDTLKKDSYYFKEIREDFLQMIFAVLKQKGVQAHQLFCDNVSNSYFENAPYSVHNMIIWMKHVITCSCNITQALSKEQSIIEKSIRYIKLHIEQDIKREDVSSYVYLNPDYLTRIFKKETGMSITEYIINERIKIAKKLLENTDMPVSSIALRVGYTNFSHFAKTFRKHVGMNPADFKNSLSVGCL